MLWASVALLCFVTIACDNNCIELGLPLSDFQGRFPLLTHNQWHVNVRGTFVLLLHS
jgi:hypothetical protein